MPPTQPLRLTPAECRVLGCLIEKEITTPEYYPLSLNALINACNQRSNREPVMDLDEEAVRQALHGLEQRNLGPQILQDCDETVPLLNRQVAIRAALPAQEQNFASNASGALRMVWPARRRR